MFRPLLFLPPLGSPSSPSQQAAHNGGDLLCPWGQELGQGPGHSRAEVGVGPLSAGSALGVGKMKMSWQALGLNVGLRVRTKCRRRKRSGRAEGAGQPEKKATLVFRGACGGQSFCFRKMRPLRQLPSQLSSLLEGLWVKGQRFRQVASHLGPETRGEEAEPRKGGGRGLTGHKVAEANGGDGDEGVVEALNVVPLLGHHEHEGRDHQVDQDAPQDEDGRARDLRLPLRVQETESDSGRAWKPSRDAQKAERQLEWSRRQGRRLPA